MWEKSGSRTYYKKNNDEKVSLKSYESYTNFAIKRCPHCNYICENFVEDIPPKDIEKVLNSGDFEYVMNYGYIQEVMERDYWEDEIAFNANEYEAYGLICNFKNDYDAEIKTLFRSILLKEALIRRFKKLTAIEMPEVDMSDIYNPIQDAIFASILVNFKEMQKAYELSQKNNIYSTMIIIDVCLKANKKQEAKELFDGIKNSLLDDIKIPIEEFFKSKEEK